MPITAPILDDLTYDRAVTELKRRIPQYTREWTNQNDSDPGITLIQLFASLAEQICWRLNRIPEKNHIELLKLLGIKLKAAEPATSWVAMLLENPADAVAGTLAVNTQLTVTSKGQNLTFETSKAISTVPCEVAAIVTTKNESLTDLLKTKTGPETAEDSDLTLAGNNPDNNPFLSISWDGKTPKLKDMPADPIDLLPDLKHHYLWLGLTFNAQPTEGFIGAKVTLTVQFNDEEQPSQTATCECGPIEPAPEAAPVINWLHCLDKNGEPIDIKGPIIDTTNQLANSGTISFFVPTTIATPAADKWKNLRDQKTDPLAACAAFGGKLNEEMGKISIGSGTVTAVLSTYVTALKSSAGQANTALNNAIKTALPEVPHSLSDELKSLSGWLRISLSQTTKDQTSPKLRIVSFNAVPVINRTTVTGELLGTSTGEAGQAFQLRNTNVQPGTLDLVVQEGPSADSTLQSWAADDLDSAKPTDRKFDMDWEAGLITFGDGRRGMIPPAVPNLGRIIARSYASGGGVAGNIAVGDIKSYSNQTLGITGIVNFVIGQGGKDAEDLDDAKIRARKTISSRSRAVTADDFKYIAEHAQGVDVALAEPIPLRVPLTAGAAFTAVTIENCGDKPTSNANTPAGLADFDAPGAVSIVVIPREDGPEPTPTPSFLAKVCEHLDQYRLVTTEIHVVPPQYCRICNVTVSVTAKAGYTRAMLQDLVAARLEKYLHVLAGGADGTGYGFGSQILAADLIAQIFRVEGIETVRDFQCQFVRTKSDASFREGKLMMCPSGTSEYSEVDLAPEETASIVPGTVSLSVV